MGASVGAALTGRGHTVRWLPAGRSDATRARASTAGLTATDDLRDLVASSENPLHGVGQPPEGIQQFMGTTAVPAAQTVGQGQGQEEAGRHLGIESLGGGHAHLHIATVRGVQDAV